MRFAHHRHQKLNFQRPKRLNPRRIAAVFVLGLILFAVSLVSLPEKSEKPDFAATEPPQQETEAHSSSAAPQTQVAQTEKPQEQPSTSPTRAEAAEVPPTTTTRGTIEAGETATQLLSPYFKKSTIYALSRQCEDIYPLTRLKAGQPYTISTREGDFIQLRYEINKESKLLIRKQDGGFTVSKKPIAYDTQTTLVSGTIDSSLYAAVNQAGEQPEFALLLAQIFAWDVDFVRDLRQGDRFIALVEKRFRQGQPSGYGKILAASFTNKNDTFQAFWYEDSAGQSSYFDAQGQSVRKTFLKAPLSFTRISSGYSNSRMHPILKKRRPHHGIDYAAPSGTPIKTVGDGVIMTRAYAKGAGRYVKVRHPNGYVTVYNHMSRFASNLRSGQKVKQGQTIGYVGSTGLSTGPHLDFRMKKNGSYINPLKVESPPCKPVPQNERDRFKSHIQPLMARLDKAQKKHLAQVKRQ